MIDPAIAAAITPKKRRFAGLSSLPMMPTAALIHTSRKVAASAAATPSLYATLPDFLTASSNVPPTAPKTTAAKAKSDAFQFTSVVNCMATSGSSRRNPAVPHPIILHGTPPLEPAPSGLLAIIVSPCMTEVGTVVQASDERHEQRVRIR